MTDSTPDIGCVRATIRAHAIGLASGEELVAAIESAIDAGLATRRDALLWLVRRLEEAQ